MTKFYDPGKLIDDELELLLTSRRSGSNLDKNQVPSYQFKMMNRIKNVAVGRIDLRIGNGYDLIMYAGHIGYGVAEQHRGHHYAARSCRLLFPLAKKHNLNPLWITCNPDNFASRRTCELAGGILVEIVNLPKMSDMYKKGERQKCRYRIELN